MLRSVLTSGAGASTADFSRSVTQWHPCRQVALLHAPGPSHHFCSQRPALAKPLHAQGASADVTAERVPSAGAKPSWDIEMLYDGDCPLCMREVNSLRKADKASKINFVNIGAQDYSPSKHADISYEEAMGKIHAIRQDGQVLTNVEAFKQLYEAAGRGWVYSFANIPPLRWAVDRIYDIWAKYRLRITGRPDLDTIMEQKKTCR